MASVLASSLASTVDHPGIRKIRLSDLREILAQGWSDFLAIPTQLVFLCILYPIIGLVAARAAVGEGLIPLLFPLVAGLTLVGPVLAVGLYELSRRREAGQPVSWLDAFSVLRSPALPSIALFGAGLFVLFGAWLASARLIYVATVGASSASAAVPDSLGGLMDVVLHAPGHVGLVLVGNMVGLIFALAVLTISVVSVPMLLDRNCSVGVAVQTSIRAVAANPASMAMWGLVVAGLLLAGSIPLFVGLAVAMPVLGHATWHLYRRVVV